MFLQHNIHGGIFLISERGGGNHRQAQNAEAHCGRGSGSNSRHPEAMEFYIRIVPDNI